MAVELPIVYIAGDVHLRGDEGPQAPFVRFLEHLARQPPAHLVLLGDLFEYWLDTGGSLARYEPVLARLRLLRARGWRLDLILGNRELTASGCHLHWPSLTLALGPRTLRIIHGDRICHDPSYHFFAAWLRSFWHQQWQALHPAPVQDLVARVLRGMSRKKKRASSPRAASRRVFIDRRRVQAAGRGVDMVIAGHIHESWQRRVGGVELVLVGDWPLTSGHWIEGFRDGRITRVQHDFDAPDPALRAVAAAAARP